MSQGVEVNERDTELASEANGDGHLLNIFMEGEEVLPDYEGGVVCYKVDTQSRGVCRSAPDSPVIRQLIRAVVLKLYKNMNRPREVRVG